MPLTNAEMPLIARKVLFELFGHLKSMDVSLTRLLELNQAPREGLFSAGSQPFGGSVGTTPGSCSLPPPTGYSPGVILAANPHRRGLAIQNLGPAVLTLGLGIQSPGIGVGYTLVGYASWNGQVSGMTWTGLVSIIGFQANSPFSGVEVLGRNETRRRGGLNQPL